MKHSFSSSIISMKSSSEYYPRATPAYSHSSLPYTLFLLALRLQSALGFFFLNI